MNVTLRRIEVLVDDKLVEIERHGEEILVDGVFAAATGDEKEYLAQTFIGFELLLAQQWTVRKA